VCSRPLTAPVPAVSEPAADPGSFQEFFEANGNRLYGALRVITRDPHEAEELAQEAFVRVWERWDRVRTMEDPVGYLYRTAMNRYRSGLRRRSVAARVRPQPVQRDEFDAADARSAVNAALARLTPRQRAALILTDLLGYTSEEAGRILGVKAVTARVLASQAMAAMRTVIGDLHG
jgi:RNA polymerase sigma factor (sigma-70 family)